MVTTAGLGLGRSPMRIPGSGGDVGDRGCDHRSERAGWIGLASCCRRPVAESSMVQRLICEMGRIDSWKI